MPTYIDDMHDQDSIFNSDKKKSLTRTAIHSLRLRKARSVFGLFSSETKADLPWQLNNNGERPRRSSHSARTFTSTQPLWGSFRRTNLKTRPSTFSLRPRLPGTIRSRGHAPIAESVRTIKDRLKRTMSRLDDFGVVHRRSSPIPIPASSHKATTKRFPGSSALRKSRSFQHFYNERTAINNHYHDSCQSLAYDHGEDTLGHAISPMPGTNQGISISPPRVQKIRRSVPEYSTVRNTMPGTMGPTAESTTTVDNAHTQPTVGFSNHRPCQIRVVAVEDDDPFVDHDDVPQPLNISHRLSDYETAGNFATAETCSSSPRRRFVSGFDTLSLQHPQEKHRMQSNDVMEHSSSEPGMPPQYVARSNAMEPTVSPDVNVHIPAHRGGQNDGSDSSSGSSPASGSSVDAASQEPALEEADGPVAHANRLCMPGVTEAQQWEAHILSGLDKFEKSRQNVAVAWSMCVHESITYMLITISKRGLLVGANHYHVNEGHGEDDYVDMRRPSFPVPTRSPPLRPWTTPTMTSDEPITPVSDIGDAADHSGPNVSNVANDAVNDTDTHVADDATSTKSNEVNNAGFRHRLHRCTRDGTPDVRSPAPTPPPASEHSDAFSPRTSFDEHAFIRNFLPPQYSPTAPPQPVRFESLRDRAQNLDYSNRRQQQRRNHVTSELD